MKITVTAYIRRVTDGVVRAYVRDRWGETHASWVANESRYGNVHGIVDTLSSIAYWWNDGNGGCDCNRRLHFHQVADEEEEMEEGEKEGFCIGHGKFELDRLVAVVEDGNGTQEFELRTEPT